jgi:hypothetical protein
MSVRSLMWLATLLVPLAAHAQTPVRLNTDDVFFQFAGVAEDYPHVGSHFTHFDKPSSKRLCGFAIRGNHDSHSNPHFEWDINIDQIITPERTAAGVSAGAFEVTNHKRTPRPPITSLSFELQGGSEPIVAEIKGTPNAANGIVALLEAEPASRLFAEFDTLHSIIISLKYADGSADQLSVSGFRDRRKFGGGNNSYFNECLRGFRVPLPGETVYRSH